MDGLNLALRLQRNADRAYGRPRIRRPLRPRERIVVTHDGRRVRVRLEDGYWTAPDGRRFESPADAKARL